MSKANRDVVAAPARATSGGAERKWRMSVDRCEKCIHWNGHHEGAPNNGFGRCVRAEHINGLMRPAKHQPGESPKTSDEFAGVLMTHAWFGCIQFEAR